MTQMNTAFILSVKICVICESTEKSHEFHELARIFLWRLCVLASLRDLVSVEPSVDNCYSNSTTGLISIVPCSAAGILAARAMASSRSWQLRM